VLGRDKMKPKKYDMSNEEDVKRWFIEMEGYLKCGYETNTNFIHQGTDFDGRVFAMDGFRQLRIIMYKHFNDKNKINKLIDEEIKRRKDVKKG
jgi:hypothetical protein